MRKIVLDWKDFDEAKKYGKISIRRNYPLSFYNDWKNSKDLGVAVFCYVYEGSAISKNYLKARIENVDKINLSIWGSWFNIDLVDIKKDSDDEVGSKDLSEYLEEYNEEDDDSEMAFDEENEKEDEESGENTEDMYDELNDFGKEDETWREWAFSDTKKTMNMISSKNKISFLNNSKDEVEYNTFKVPLTSYNLDVEDKSFFGEELEVLEDKTFSKSYSDVFSFKSWANFVLNAFFRSQKFFENLDGYSITNSLSLWICQSDYEGKQYFQFKTLNDADEDINDCGDVGLVFDCYFCFGNIVCSVLYKGISFYFVVNVLSDVKRVSSVIKEISFGEFEKYSKSSLKSRSLSRLIEKNIFVSSYDKFLKSQNQKDKKRSFFNYWNLAFCMLLAFCLMLIATCYNYRCVVKNLEKRLEEYEPKLDPSKSKIYFDEDYKSFDESLYVPDVIKPDFSR